jgi:rod shape-determining protein MreD
MKTVKVFAAVLLATAIRLATARLFPTHFHLVDPFLVAVVWLSLSDGPVAGQLGGLAAGWVQDALSGSLFGLHAFALILIGYLAAYTAQRLVVGRRLALLAAFALAAAVQQAVIAVLLLLLVPAPELPPAGLLLLAQVTLTALFGMAWIQSEASLMRRLRRWRRSRRRGLQLS